MLRRDFDFELPNELIARYPAPRRDASRLLLLDGATGACSDHQFTDLPALLEPGDLLVVNDSRVMPARLRGRKPTGGRVELLVERLLGPSRCLAWARPARTLATGARILLPGNHELRVAGRRRELFEMERVSGPPFMELLQSVGRTPLPPYLGREDEPLDRRRYQTVYADQPGSAAAPTAGLHFTRALLRRLQRKGVDCARITLHVGAGTFQPLRDEVVEKHCMHEEWCRLEAAACAQVRTAKQAGRRVVAVGTTAARCLETAARGGRLRPFQGETDIFIYPGFRFQAVDALITNFHLPGSSLLLLVCAFAGRDNALRAYRHAVASRYRFFSYGDAMFISCGRRPA